MSVSVRSLGSAACFAIGAALSGCNLVLGINEPEEVPSSNVRIYPWDGASAGDAAEAGDAGTAEIGDVSSVDVGDESIGNADGRLDAGPTCSNVPTPDGGVCGGGCASLCPLGRACLKDGDCASGRCYAARCTLATCINGMRDGNESDTDCGGLCATCGAGRACRTTADCTSRICTNGSCQAPPVDASGDVRLAPDASNTVPDAPGPVDADASGSLDVPVSTDGRGPADASDVGDTSSDVATDVIGSVDRADAGGASDACEGGCPLCACSDGG